MLKNIPNIILIPDTIKIAPDNDTAISGDGICFDLAYSLKPFRCKKWLTPLYAKKPPKIILPTNNTNSMFRNFVY